MFVILSEEQSDESKDPYRRPNISATIGILRLRRLRFAEPCSAQDDREEIVTVTSLLVRYQHLATTFPQDDHPRGADQFLVARQLRLRGQQVIALRRQP